MVTHPDELQSIGEAKLARCLSPEAFDAYVKARTESSVRFLAAMRGLFARIKSRIVKKG
jgi:hypothetical protein